MHPTQSSGMNVGRNDPCPCGSGKKYKHCHGRAVRNQPDPEEAAWRRLRAALDGFPTMILRFIGRVYGPHAIDEAWGEFTLWEGDEPRFDPDSPDLQVFLPWFFHQWSPDAAETDVTDASLHDRSPTRVLLERRGRRLDPALGRHLEACLAAPFSFHEIMSVEPGRGFRARDLLLGEEHEVMERSASRLMQAGDLFFGQLVTSDGITLMEACSSQSIPPRQKLELIDLRERIVGDGPPISAETLRDWDIELRQVYLERMDALRNPQLPRLQNTDGDPIAFHRLFFEVPSAQEAFDALRSLASDETERELLESADFDEEGSLQKVEFAWKRAGNAVHNSWENTVLGTIEIDGSRLVASVNSVMRAARLRALIGELYPDARGTRTEVETVDEAMAARAETAGREEDLDKADTPSPALIPEVRARIREIMAKHYENWVDEAIPALGGRSPMEAVQERSGREKVEALIAQIERDGARTDPPLDDAVTRRMRERLGLAE